jgi:thiol-disulfide isomerase/thioredoxin
VAALAPDARAQGARTPEDAGLRPGIRRKVELPNATDLAADAAASAKGGLPILLFFERDECPYCERALREYLVPFARNEWKGKAIFRQVGIDRTLSARDFDGGPTTHQAIAARFGIIFSPTVLVVDGRGRPLAEPIVGLTLLDFYGAYVNDALSTGARKLRA